jgi:D-arabinono-1,4-lactone oxidase
MDATNLKGSDGYYYPSSEEEIVALIRYGRDNKKQVRAHGSRHSVRESIGTDTPYPTYNWAEGPQIDDDQVNIKLDKYRQIVSWDDQKKRVTVQSGIRLGVADHQTHFAGGPYYEEGTFFKWLNDHGWAWNDTGGISHQAVAGFLTTGSAGSSVRHSIEENVVALRLIDGEGSVHECSRDAGDDLFFAAGISMGLLGIISTITFEVVDRYYIHGHESIKLTEDWITPELDSPKDIEVDTIQRIDFFGNGKEGFLPFGTTAPAEKLMIPSVADFLKRSEYARIFWWPQEDVQKFVVWHSRRLAPDEASEMLKTKGEKPYVEVTPIITESIGEAVGSLGYLLVDNIPDMTEGIYNGAVKALKEVRIFAPRIYERFVTRFPDKKAFAEPVLDEFVPWLLNQYVVEDKEGSLGQEFLQVWHHGLPLDNQVSDSMLGTVFMEIWFELSEADKVMRRLAKHFNGYKTTGSFAVEIYATRASKFWMSSAYRRDVFRVDVFYYRNNKQGPEEFYRQFWELFRDMGFRPHWGKYLPQPFELWQDYYRKNIPRLNDFLAMRTKLDPHNLFLTEYWMNVFGIYG